LGQRDERSATATKRVYLISMISLVVVGFVAACWSTAQGDRVATSTRTTVGPAAATSAGIAAEATESLPPTVTPFPEEEAAPATAGGGIKVDTLDKLDVIDSLMGHADRVYGLGFSSDGRLLASGSRDGTIRVWDVASRQELITLVADGDWDVFFAPEDGHVASTNGTLWAVASGEEVRSFDVQGGRAAFSPDGASMASAGYNAPIQLWDLKTGRIGKTLAGHTDRVFGLAFSTDSARLASGSGIGPSDVSDYTVKIWDLESGLELHTLQGHSGDIYAVAFSPDSRLVASASTNYTVRLWDVERGELVHTMWHSDGLWAVGFSPDGELLALGGVDCRVRLWDVASGQQLRSLRHGDEVMAVAFSPDGALLASAGYDDVVYLWGVPLQEG
jgi:WD40 repeat protein